MTITPDELASITARLAAIGSGNWRVNRIGDVVEDIGDQDTRIIAEMIDVDGPIAPFIAHAPADIAALLAEVERLREELGWPGRADAEEEAPNG